jgi:hypothetical protein
MRWEPRETPNTAPRHHGPTIQSCSTCWMGDREKTPDLLPNSSRKGGARCERAYYIHIIRDMCIYVSS